MKSKKQPIIGKRGRGRPPSSEPVRSKKVSFSLTPDDAEWFEDFSKEYGFKSRSELFTCVMERLRICGFSGVGGLKLCLQMQGRCERSNPSRYKQTGLDLDALRPFPPLPEAAPIEAETLADTLAQITEEFRNERKAT